MKPAAVVLSRLAGALLPLLGLLLPQLAPAQVGTCVRNSEICTDGPATKLISGYPVTRDCWRYQADYTCRSLAMTNDCATLAGNPQCGPVGSDCVETDAAGV